MATTDYEPGWCPYCGEPEEVCQKLGCRDPGDYDDEERGCWHCRGEGWGIVGDDWDCDDPVNGPYPGEVEKCPCCNGSGKAEDCTFW